MLDRGCAYTLLFDEWHAWVRMKHGSGVGDKTPATTNHNQCSQAVFQVYIPACCGFTSQARVARHGDGEDQGHVA